MMLLSFSVIIIATFVAVVAGAYNQAFCRKNIGVVGDADTTGFTPNFYDNFYVFIERKIILSKAVVYQDEYYSQKDGLEYGTLRGHDNQTQLWVDVKNNEIMETYMDFKFCLHSNTSQPSTNRLMGVFVDSQNKVSLNKPDVALGWDRKSMQEKAYRGSDTVRGIRTLKWHFCAYNEVTDLTTFNEWHIVDPDTMLLPAVSLDKVSSLVLPVMINIYGEYGNGTGFNDRLDLTFFDSVKSDDKVFQIPIEKLCGAKPSAQVPLPTSPSYFKFRGEQVTVTNYYTQNQDTADVVYTVEEYTQLSQLFIQDVISSLDNPFNGDDKSLKRNINDYSTGLSFQMDLISGSCSVNIIPPIGVDSISVAGGHAKMRTSQQFFDLDSDQYQYMGIHNMRGIDCDTWSAYFTEGKTDHDQNALYTWYFASEQWMKKYGFDSTHPLPVTLEIHENDDLTQFNFYEFDIQDDMRLPDVSLCFDPKTTLNVEFIISASYVLDVAPDVRAFNRAVYSTIVKLTSLRSIVRLSDLDVQPSSSNEVVVRFKLLDISTVESLGNASLHDATNLQIYNDLNQVINTGTFSVDIVSDDSGTGKRTVKAKPNSVGQFSKGKFLAATNSKSSSSGFSAGAMGGIAIGMLVLGIILGVVIKFAVNKIRTGGSGSGINMTKLNEESQS